ncbi:MAG: phage tail tape measure protein [Lachnospiraceae bacterium]|nr:phage tail tape measure protein [Lachnospiraceae bacterium]
MAGSRKEFELLFKLRASLGGNFSSSFKSADTTVKGLQNSLTKINSIQSKISGYQKQTQAIEQNKSKLEALTREHERLQAEMQATESPSEALRQKMVRNETQMQTVTNRIRGQETALENLQDELQASGVNTDNLTRSNEKLQKSYDQIKKSQENIAKISQAQQKNSAAISQTKGQITSTIGLATAAAAALYAGPVKAAQAFEAQMSTVGAISGASATDLEKLASAAKAAGRETKFSAKESGQALEYMSMAGWKTQQMTDGLPGVMNLAAASGEDLASVSGIVTGALSAFKLQASDAAHFSDVLAQTSSNSNTNVALLGESFKYAASTAGALNYSVEDVSVALGLMANNNIAGSQSGTSLKNLLANLAKPTAKMSATMSKLNISLTDSNGEMKPLNELLVGMRGSFAGLSEAEKAAAASTLAGKEGMSGLLAIINTSDKDFNTLTTAINGADGAAQRMAAIRLDNYEGQLTLCKSAIESFNIAMGEAMLPIITEGIKKVTEIVSTVAAFAEENPELIKTILKVSAALIGFKLAGLGIKLAFLEIKGGVLGVQKTFEIFKGGLAALKVGALELPGVFTKIGAAFGKVGGSGIGKMFTKGFKGIGGIVIRALAPITGIFTRALAPIGNIFGKILGPVGKIFSPLLKIFGAIGGFLGPILPAAAAIMAIIVAIQLLTGNLDKIREKVGQIFGEQGLAVFDGIVNAINTVKNVLMGAFSDSNLDAAREKINGIFGPQGVAVFNGAITILKAVGGAFMNIWNTINTYVTPLVQQLFNYVVNVVLPAVGAKFAEWAPTISAIITGLGQGISAVIMFVSSVISVALPVIKAIFENAFSAIGTVIGSILGIFEGVINVIKGVFTGDIETVLEGIKGIFKSIFEGIEAVAMAPINAIKDGIGGLIDKIRGVKDEKIEGPTDTSTGKRVNGFAKGTAFTPNTFIAGEEGPELITGAAGRKVFTAAQTKKIFANINTSRSERTLPFSGSTTGGGSKGEKNIQFSYSPTVIVDGSRPNDLEQKLDENNEKMFKNFKQWLKDAEEDERRLVYA